MIDDNGASLSIFGGYMAKVLIVDDSPTETYKLTSILEKHGYVVSSASSGADGVAKAKAERPDLVPAETKRTI